MFRSANTLLKAPLSPRALITPQSATIAVSSLARKMERGGLSVYDLGIGEPDMRASLSVRRAVAESAENGHRIYSDIRGLPSTLAAMASLMKSIHHVNYDPQKNIMCFDGGKPALDCVIQTLISEGNQVIIPTPSWLSYIPQVMLAEGQPVCIASTIENRFKITPEQLQNAITAETKAFVFCPLNNPTGIIYSEQEIRALGDVLKNYPQIFIISDDLYWSLQFSHIAGACKNVSSFAKVCPDLIDRIINVTGTTKSHSWRFAAVATTHEDIINRMANIHSHRAGHPNLEAQAGARKAIELGPDFARARLFEHRHSIVFPLLKGIPEWQTIESDGAFYFFVRVQDHMDRLNIEDDVTYAKIILERTGVATVPGSAFGSPGHLRLSYCQDEEVLKLALEKLSDFTAQPEVNHSQSASSLSLRSR